MNRIAIIDIGTQSILLLIVEKKHDNTLKTLDQQIKSIRLGENLKTTRQINLKAIQRAENAILECQQIIQNAQIEKTIVVGTQVFRLAINKDQVLYEIKKRTGFDIEVLSETGEAYWGYIGAIGGNTKQKTWVLDIGGGSTEMTCGYQDRILHSWSLPLGAVTLTETFLPIDGMPINSVLEMQDYIQNLLQSKLSNAQTEKTALIGIGGTITTLTAMEQKMNIYNPKQINGFVLSGKTIQTWLEKLISLPVQKRQSLPGLIPERADIIVAGVAILIKTLEIGGWQEITVSDRGLRYGIAMRELYKL